MTANALAFLNAVSNAGYDACIYASENFLEEHLYANQISSSFKVWLANYSSKTNYKGDYEFWQHTAKGRVSGMRVMLISIFGTRAKIQLTSALRFIPAHRLNAEYMPQLTARRLLKMLIIL